VFCTKFGTQLHVLQVDIPIHVVEGDSMFVTFEGQGFDERESEPIQVQDGCITVPCTQRIPVPGQVRVLDYTNHIRIRSVPQIN